MACPICILRVGSYLRHNKGAGTTCCTVSREVVMTLHLSSVKRLCLVSPIQTRRVQPEFKRKLKGRGRFLLPPVSVTPHLLGLAPLEREVVDLTAGWRYAGETHFFLPAPCLKQVCCKAGFVIFQGISRGLWLSQPQGSTLSYQGCGLWGNALQSTWPMKKQCEWNNTSYFF